MKTPNEMTRAELIEHAAHLERMIRALKETVKRALETVAELKRQAIQQSEQP